MLRRICLNVNHRPRARGQGRRRAFTLVELLIVISLMIVLMGLTLLIIPSINSQQQATRAGTQLQQWIEIAKQRAARDRAPRGIRLIPGAANPLEVTQLEYTEQPPDFFLGAGSSVQANGTTVIFSGNSKTLTGDGGDPPVQAGDRIALGTGEIHTIFKVNTGTKLTLFSAASPITSSQYRIIRKPRPIGDELLQMPQGIIIDCAPRGISGGVYDLDGYLGAGPIDIMFAPDGRVIGQLAGLDKIILWVRDPSVPGGPGDPPPAQGDPTLVCIYPRTGLIAACQVDLFYTNTNPYTFTANGRRSSN